MFPPLVSPTDVDAYEFPDIVADAYVGGAGMGAHDQLARAIGHAEDWSSDEMGAACSVYHADATTRRLFAVAATLDYVRARIYDAGYLSRPSRIAPPVPYAAPTDADTVYVRSDDRGFWSAILTTRDQATAWLAEWEAANVPDLCEVCGDVLDPDADIADACSACAGVIAHY